MKWRYDPERGYLHVSQLANVPMDLWELRKAIKRELISDHLAAIIFRVTDDDILFLRGWRLRGWLEWESRHE